MKDPGVLLATVERSGFTESVHLGHAVLIDPDGSVIETWGSPAEPFFPRSANKPLQAAGLVDAGLTLTGRQLAIASGSHSGEAFHLLTVREILAEGGLTEDDLENTPALPVGHEALLAWVRSGRGDAALTQNCSGKHAAMLRTAQVLAAPTRGYRDPEHPVQRAALAGIVALGGESPTAVGVDGCGAPVAAISLVGLARAYSLLVQSGPDTAGGTVAAAMSAHPEYVAGTGRDVTAFMRALPGAIAKDGAESVSAFALPDGRAGAVKISDGGERARPAAVAGLLARLGVSEDVLSAVAPAPVLGGGRPVGAIRPAF